MVDLLDKHKSRNRVLDEVTLGLIRSPDILIIYVYRKRGSKGEGP